MSDTRRYRACSRYCSGRPPSLVGSCESAQVSSLPLFCRARLPLLCEAPPTRSPLYAGKAIVTAHRAESWEPVATTKPSCTYGATPMRSISCCLHLRAKHKPATHHNLHVDQICTGPRRSYPGAESSSSATGYVASASDTGHADQDSSSYPGVTLLTVPYASCATGQVARRMHLSMSLLADRTRNRL